jgi:putative spermidine/putrescine transport system permease protein
VKSRPAVRGPLIWLFAPAVAVFSAFWLLPMARLALMPASGPGGLLTYFAVLTEWRYFKTLLQTTVLSVSVTALSIALAAVVGFFLARHRFLGRNILLALLTLPLSFPGVVIGFFIILLAGRQGLVADISQVLGSDRVAFAYGFAGLFLGYIYFSLPRAIASYTAACEKLDVSLEEAALSLGAKRSHLVRDVIAPALMPTTIACGSIIFATAMGAFGTAFTLSSSFDVLPITIYNEFTNYANFALAAALSLALGLITWLVLFATRVYTGQASASMGAA